MDLSPRSTTELDAHGTAPSVRRAKKRWPAFLLLAVVVVGAGAIVTKFLTSALDYYCNADEVGVKDDCSEGRRLRVQGTVERGTVQPDGDQLLFAITFNGVTVPVRYDGTEPGGIFKECVPVVAAGEWRNGEFFSDRIEVKHSNEYVADNGERIEQAESGTCPEAG